MKKILIVDDEKPIREMVRLSLELAGFTCIEADKASQAMPIIIDQKPDLVLLDWMMPEISGIEMIRKIRRDDSLKDLAVILLTAKVDENNAVVGLNSGADDYIRKPFNSKELVARINSLLRRKYGGEDEISVPGLKVDPKSQRVYINDTLINIGPTEYRLLKFFLLNQDRVYSRAQLLDQVWGVNVYIEERTIDVHIRRLRKCLTYDKNNDFDIDPGKYIQTVRGTGYRFSVIS
jgi:two-component system phosphate regulon response regulator PhoB